ncbi:MFS transporter [Planctomycetota bacterium]|nr:MFS transporter [Planctomycetota bacterium]
MSRLLWLYFLAVFLMGVGHGIFRVLRNQYIVDLGMDDTAYSFVQGVNGIGGLLIAIPAIAIIGRVKAKTLVAFVALVNGLAFAAQGLFGNIESFLGGAFFAGIAMSLNMAIAAPFLMRNTNKTQRIFAFTFQAIVGHPLAGAIGSFLSGTIQSTVAANVTTNVTMLGNSATPELFGYQVALLVAGGFMFAAMIPALLMRGDTHNGKNKTIRQLLKIHDKKRVAILCVPEMIIGLGAGLTIPFFNVYFKKQWELPPAEIGYVFTAMAILQVVSFLLAPALVKRFGPIKVIIGSQLLSLPFFVELAIGDILFMAIGAFILRNILMNLCQPVLKQFSQEVVHPDDQNAIGVAFHASRHAMWTVGNFLAGPLIIWAGGDFSYAFIATIICYVLAIAVEIVMYPRMLRSAKVWADEPEPATAAA